jgi:uncharacterized protein (DUF302 family)
MRTILFLAILLLQSTHLLADEWITHKKVNGSFIEAKESLIMAIENRGLVINYTSHIAEMLERTGNDLGSNRKIFGQAEIIEFCSAKLSRRMMEIDPHNIVMCPFSIAVYTLPGEKGTAWLSYRKPQGNAAPIVAELLGSVVAEASQ